jgi:TonB-linked SusC/RagA family outer membrane protein
MNRIVLMGFLLLILLVNTALGQAGTITGIITDAADGNTLPGATVLIKGTSQGTVTDPEGRYNIQAEPDAVLVFSYIGMETLEIPIAGRSIVNVEMRSVAATLTEFVVMGYGTAREVGTVVGSISTVSSQTLESRPVANVWDAMQGQVAGLQVYTSSGEPTASSSVRLHGRGSLTAGATPLYVLDGIPVSSGNILSLNPNDIESVTVLKDASATSIYGSRAANGVIFITTKSGKLGEQAIVNVNAQYGFSSLANPSYYDKFMNRDELFRLRMEYAKFNNPADTVNVLNIFAANPHDTRWVDYFLNQSAPTFQTDMSIQGGSGRTRYYVSGSYFFQDGLASRSEYERYSARANVTSTANNWLSFGTNVGLSYDERQTAPGFGDSFIDGGLFELNAPIYSPWDENGEEYDFIPGVGFYGLKYLEQKLPASGNNTQLNFSAYAQINPIQGLVIRSQAGLDGYDWRYTFIQMPSFLRDPGNGELLETFQRSYTKTITNTAEYKFNIGPEHSFITLAGQEFVDNTWGVYHTLTKGLTDDRMILLGFGDNATVQTAQQKEEYAFHSLFARFDYGYDRKYFMDFSVRQDQSSRFGRENRTANFWAAGLRWNIDREDFISNLDWLSTMSMKFSIGTSGNSEFENYKHFASVSAGMVSSYGGGASWSIVSPGNPALTWENQRKTTLGLQFSILQDRYRFNIEAYDRQTSSMLFLVPQPFTSGFDVLDQNVGGLVNRGIDIEFNFDASRGRNHFFTPYFNFNYNRDKITELFHGMDYWAIPNTGVVWIVGQPVGFLHPIFAGIDPEDGKPMWYIPGEDRKVTTKKETTKFFDEDALQQNTGLKRYAPISGGFGFASAYRGFQLSADFSFVKGKNMINNDRYFFENPTLWAMTYNQSRDVLDYWKQPGDVTTFPALSEQFIQFDTRLIEDASFMRLKNLTLGYQLPESFLGGSNFIAGARLFLTARNLITFTNFTGPDPEHDSNLTRGVNPNTRQYSLGVSLTF